MYKDKVKGIAFLLVSIIFSIFSGSLARANLSLIQ